MAPVASTLLGLWSGSLVDCSEAEIWTTITSGLSDPGLVGAPGAKLTGTRRTRSGVAVEHHLGKKAPKPAPRRYELFVTGDGRTNDRVACLANLIHADLTGDLDLEAVLGKKRAAVIQLTTESGPSSIFVHPPSNRRCWINTSYGKVEFLQVTPLSAEEAVRAERDGVSALLAAPRARG